MTDEGPALVESTAQEGDANPIHRTLAFAAEHLIGLEVEALAGIPARACCW